MEELKESNGALTVRQNDAGIWVEDDHGTTLGIYAFRSGSFGLDLVATYHGQVYPEGFEDWPALREYFLGPAPAPAVCCPHCGRALNVGALLGARTSSAKAAAARANGRKGGRPRKA